MQGICPPRLQFAACSSAGGTVTLVAISNNLCLEDALEEIFPNWVLLQDQPGLIRIRSGLVWEAQEGLSHNCPAFKLCFCASFALHGGDVLARALLQRRVSLVLRHCEVFSSFLKGTMVSIWSTAALLPYPLPMVWLHPENRKK